MWSCERFHLYLHGMLFEHTPKSKPCVRIKRWVLCLQPYNFKVVYNPLSQNIANSLSRLTAIVKIQKRYEAEDYVKFVVQTVVPGMALTARDVECASANDLELQELEKCIRPRNWEDCKCTRYKMVHEDIMHDWKVDFKRNLYHNTTVSSQEYSPVGT